MRLKTEIVLIILIQVLVFQNRYSCECLTSNSQLWPPSITQNPRNVTVTEEKALNIPKKEFPDIPENNIGTLVTNTTSFSLNAGFTQENCRAILCFKNASLLHKRTNTGETLNRIFYKSCLHRKKEYDKLTKESIQKENETSKYSSRKLVKRTAKVNGTMEHSHDHTEPSNEAEIKVTTSTPSNMSLATTRSSILEFPDTPPGNLIKVVNLKLEEGYFRIFSDLIGYLQSTSFPLDFLKSLIKNQIPSHLVIIKAIKIEGPVLCWLFIWLILSLAVPCAITVQSCCNKKGLQKLHDNYSIASYRYRDKWIGILTMCLMHLLLLLLLCNVALMIISNEEISQAASTTPNRVKTVFEGIETFVDNTQLQISSVTTSSMQIAVEAVHKHLEDGEELLGKSLRQALHDETGLETAIQALSDLTAVAADQSLRVSALIKDCNKARSAGRSLQGSLIELSKVLTLARQECVPRDRPLCDTLPTEPFSVTLYVDQLTWDYHLEQLAKISFNENLNRTIEIAQRSVQELPKRVSLETAASRTEIRSVLNKHRNNLFDSLQSFEDSVNSLKSTIIRYKNAAEPIAENIANNDLWRWLIMLGLSVLTFLVWGLMMCGAPCGCDCTPKTILFLQTGLGLTCVLSLIMWVSGAVSFLMGGHCHLLICQPLYDDPSYITLNDLLNTRGIISRSDDNLLYRILKANSSLRVDGIFNNCHSNHSAFQTFDLHAIFNIDTLTNAKEWCDYNDAVKRFPAILNNFEVLSPNLQENLEEFSSFSRVNLTMYRVNISQPVTNKDLSSLADQLRSVAKHLSDARAAENMEHLAFRTQILVETDFQRLKKIRDDILYQMTALEIFLPPINQQINLSLSHLKAIQYFVDNNGFRISKEITEDYIDGFNRSLVQMHTFIMKKIFYEIGNCYPLWETFDMVRVGICNMIVDPLNGFSIACFCCILLFLGLAPVTVTAIENLRMDGEGSFDSITHRRARNGMLIDEEGTWATPSPRNSSEDYYNHNLLPSEVNWTISRRIEPTIPGPPRFPEDVALPLESNRICAPTPATPPTSTRDEGISSISSITRIMDSTRYIQSHLRPEPHPTTPSTSFLIGSSQSIVKAKASRRPELSRIKSPIPRIIQAMTSKARKHYESLKMIERVDRLSPKSWL